MRWARQSVQAITAVRLLLHSGQLRTVLLICPKPLVANWQRQFNMWALEVPVTIIEGDQTRRRWRSPLTDIPVKIANYEILHRDREVLEELDALGRPRLMFDLVILDESQRIKNRAGGTARRSGRSAEDETGPYRHAGGEFLRGPGGHLRIPCPRIPIAGDETAANRPGNRRLRAPPH